MLKTCLPRLAACLLLLVLALTGCSRQSTELNLKDEFALGRVDSLLFLKDFLTVDAAVSTREGWSRLKENGTRLGVYPRSQLHVYLNKKRPLYLVGSCSPIRGGGIPAETVSVQVNSQEIGVIKLEKESHNLVALEILEEQLSQGHNTIEFLYSRAAGESEAVSGGAGRDFTVIFHELTLTSHPRLNYARRILALKEKFLQDHEDAFIQLIPSTADLYLGLPSRASLSAEGEFYLIAEDFDPDEKMKLEIMVSPFEGDEQIIREFVLSGKDPRFKIKDMPLPAEGPARLRFQAEVPEAEEVRGFLIWKNARISGDMDQVQYADSPQSSLDTLRASLSEKNTVIIILDAARADRFSTYGHFRPTTPEISKFGEEGIVFLNAFSESLSTRSSIATLFTGFPLSVTTVRYLRSRLPDAFKTLAEHFQSIEFKTTGFTGVGNIGSVFGFTQGFDEYFELYKNDDFYRKSQEYLPYLFPWLEANRGKKFFLYVHFKEPHAHYSPLPPFLGMFSGSYKDKVGLSEYKEMAGALTTEQVEYIRACYDETLASADSAVGEFFDKMSSLDLMEESLIILTSDHGELLGEKGRVFGHGKSFAEEGIHIPLVIRLPGDVRSTLPDKIEGMVKISDIYATLADIYQFEVPFGLTGGKSLLPLLLTPEKEIQSYIIIERAGTPVYCFRTKMHKLLYSRERAIQFFDLETDPEEKNDLYTQEHILANYYLTELKKWISGQELTRSLLLGEGSEDGEIDHKQIDEKTLENLKTLGYIK